MKRWFVAVVAVLAALTVVLTGCSGGEGSTSDPSASEHRPIRIGKGLTHESETLAYLYAGALRDAGYKTEVIDSATSREQYVGDMKVGGDSSPDVVPDYSGNLLLGLTHGGKDNPQASATPSPTESSGIDPRASASVTPSPTPTADFNVHGMSSSDITATLPKVLPDGVGTLNASSAENKDALVVNRITAAKFKLSTISDVAEKCQELTFGVPKDFPSKTYGEKGLRDLYGCSPKKFVEVDNQEDLANQLASGQVDVADIFSASAAIPDNNYLVLEDPKANFVAQQVIPVVRKDELPDSARDAINSLSGKLATADLIFLDRLTTGDQPISAEDAANFWLKENDG